MRSSVTRMHVGGADVAELEVVRTPITDTLAGLGVRPDMIEVVINCHLHAADA